MAEQGKRLEIGGGRFRAAVITALLAVQSLSATAIAGLATASSVWWLTALIVAAGLLLIAVVLSLIARREVKSTMPLVPEEAIDGFKTDVAEIKKDAHS
jgi:hypothetical protein